LFTSGGCDITARFTALKCPAGSIWQVAAHA
jgi:hypothetical protein